MQNIALFIIVIGAGLIAAGALKWRLSRKTAARQAFREEAMRNSASLDAFAERECGALGRTTAEIFKHDDSKIIEALNYRIDQKTAVRITQPERRLVAVYWLRGEVSNGGFDQ